MQKTNQLRWVILSLVIIIFDQASKFFVVKTLAFQQSVTWLPFINIELAYNTGAAFSFLGGAGGWQRWLFVVVAAFISICILIWLYRAPRNDNWTACAFAFILAGALGNLYDRVLFGNVTDFIDLHVGHIHFPALFNVADVAINIGVIMWIIAVIFRKEQR